MIIGSGSASFEIIKKPNRKTSNNDNSKMVGTKAQPIAVDVLLLYLQNGFILGKLKKI